MRTLPTLAWLGAAVLALAGCGEKQEPQRQNTAGGEILARSVDDSMLPYDTVRSQPPLAPPPRASGSGGKESADDAAEEDGNEEGAQADPVGEAVTAGEARAKPAGE